MSEAVMAGWGVPGRPTVRRALDVVRRDRLTVQFGVDPERTVAYRAAEPGVADLVERLDGRWTPAMLAARHGLPRAVVDTVLTELVQAGVVEDVDGSPWSTRCRSGHPGCPGEHPPASTRGPERVAADRGRRLQSDIAAWDLLSVGGDPPAAEWQRRRRATVAIDGAGRVGTAIALLLAGAGVGELVAMNDGPLRSGERVHAGPDGEVVGLSRAQALRRRVTAVEPDVRVVAASDALPDIAVLTEPAEPDRAAAAALARDGVPHLLVSVRETMATLGPFVLPGRSACLRCLDLARTDRDPGWPLVLDRRTAAHAAAPASPVAAAHSRTLRRAAMTTGRARVVPAGDGVLATLVAAAATLHVLAVLRGDIPASVDATIEYRIPDGIPRRRSWAVHPACGCGWGH